MLWRVTYPYIESFKDILQSCYTTTTLYEILLQFESVQTFVHINVSKQSSLPLIRNPTLTERLFNVKRPIPCRCRIWFCTLPKYYQANIDISVMYQVQYRISVNRRKANIHNNRYQVPKISLLLIHTSYRVLRYRIDRTSLTVIGISSLVTGRKGAVKTREQLVPKREPTSFRECHIQLLITSERYFTSVVGSRKNRGSGVRQTGCYCPLRETIASVRFERQAENTRHRLYSTTRGAFSRKVFFPLRSSPPKRRLRFRDCWNKRRPSIERTQ